jgi:hypothetical protein
LLPIIKRTSLREHYLLGLAGLLIIVSIAGCNTRIQGCLDVNAENFNLNAEQDCDGCCAYPTLSLSLTQKWGDRNFASSDTLFDIDGDPYKIYSLKYFLSDWIWEDGQGIQYHVDSATVVCDDAELKYSPDNPAISIDQFNFTLGMFRTSPVIESLRFNLGISQDFSCLDAENPEAPLDLTDQSPLWNPQTASLETMRLIVQRDTSVESFDTIFISDEALTTLTYPFEFTPGSDAQFKLTVDYSLWFKDVNTDSLASFRQSIISNFAGSITLTQ